MIKILKRLIIITCALAMMASFCLIANADSEGNNITDDTFCDAAGGVNPAPWDHIVSVVAGNGFTVGLRSDGRVAYAGDNNSESIQRISEWKDIVRIEVVDTYYIVGYRADGSVALTSIENDYDHPNESWREEDISEWKAVEQLCFTENCCVARLKDGSVVIQSRKANSAEMVQEISEWNDIIQILEYPHGVQNFFGLRADGTVRCFPADDEVEQWTDVTKLVADHTIGGAQQLYGITESGSVYQLCDGLPPNEALAAWTDISDLEVCFCNCIYGITKDGRVCLTGYDSSDFREEQRDVTTWTDLVQFCARLEFTWGISPIGLKADGTVVSICDETERDVSGWREIRQLFCGADYTIGLRKDGTVAVTGNRGYNPALSEIENWTDISEIITRTEQWKMWTEPEEVHFIGLKCDGTVVAAGDNSMGQCNVYADSGAEEAKPDESGTKDRDSTNGEKRRENLCWSISDTGVLTISGDGEMENFMRGE